MVDEPNPPNPPRVDVGAKFVPAGAVDVAVDPKLNEVTGLVAVLKRPPPNPVDSVVVVAAGALVPKPKAGFAGCCAAAPKPNPVEGAVVEAAGAVLVAPKPPNPPKEGVAVVGAVDAAPNPVVVVAAGAAPNPPKVGFCAAG